MPFVVMIAGPNGSGKTTLVNHIRSIGIDLGSYVNADDIAAELSGPYDARVRAAQKIADERRKQLLDEAESFTFETVMSHESKIDFFDQAARRGFTTVLYFISTGDPALNVERVAQRVLMGGHDVPADKIVARYERTMILFPRAFAIADRAFVFQNSGPEGLVLGLTKQTTPLSDGRSKVSLWVDDEAPLWMRAVYDAITSDDG